MEIYRSDNIICSFSYLSKRIAIGLLYPLLVVILLSIKGEIGIGSWPFFYLFAVIMTPFSIFITVYIIVRCKYNLISFDIDDTTSEIDITYYKFRKVKKIHTDKSAFYVNFRKDNYTIGEYYVLDFYLNDERIFTQYQEGEWSVESFFNITKTLIDNSVRCKYSFTLKKRLLDDE